MAKSKVEITAVDRTGKAFRSATSGLQRIGRVALSTRTAVLALAGAGGFGLLIKSAFDAGDALAKTADKLGVTTQALAGLRQAAALSGVESRTLDMALQRMTRRIAEAAVGTGEAKDAIKQLGLDARVLAQQSPDQAFAAIAQKMAQVSTQGERVRLAFKLFDSEGVAVVNTLAMGREGLEAARKEAEQLGTALTRVEAAKLEQANDAMLRVKTAFQGVAAQIAIQLAPVVTAIANRFVNAAKDSNGFRDSIVNGMETAANAIGFVADTFHVFHVGIKTIMVGLAHILDFFVQIPASFDVAVTDLHNIIAKSFIGKMLGMEVAEYNKTLQLMVEASQHRLGELEAELFTLVAEGFPSEKVQAFFQSIREEAEKSAGAIAQARGAAAAGGIPLPALPGQDNKFEEDQAKDRENFEQMRARFDEVFAAQIEFRDRLLELDRTYRELGLEQDQAYNEIREQIELEHQARLGNIMAKAKLEGLKFERLTSKQKLQTVFGFAAQELQAVATTNKAIFELQRGFTLAEIALSAPGAIAQAIERGGGLPWGAVFGAITFAKYAALAASAAGASFSGSTSAASVGGGGATPVTPATPASQQLAPPQVAGAERGMDRQFDIQITGSRVITLTDEDIRDRFLPQFIEAIQDGVAGRGGRTRINLSLG